ncbi:MAG: hypothetical protein ACD_39C00961G0001 [uncultured bacterium]|nr:MAG: hypothetical protein ACD_39C00961G0001 [uncultured bacterium]
MNMQTAIEIKGFTKSYDHKTNVLEDLNLSIPQGAIFSLLGPNGSGKTTTVRMLNGMLQPTAGTATVHDLDTATQVKEIHRLSGIMTETAQPYGNLTADENLLFFGRMHGLSVDEIRDRAERLLGIFDLIGARGQKVKTYSTGMKKRLMMAIVLLHRPKVLFLDEPTSGLDPEAARSVTDLVKKLAVEENVTIFLCTHQLSYAEEIGTLFGFLAKGRLIGFGTLPELLKQKRDAVRLQIFGEAIPETFASFSSPDGSYTIPIAENADAARIIAEIAAGGGRIYEARQIHMSLDDLYFAFQKDGRA